MIYSIIIEHPSIDCHITAKNGSTEQTSMVAEGRTYHKLQILYIPGPIPPTLGGRIVLLQKECTTCFGKEHGGLST